MFAANIDRKAIPILFVLNKAAMNISELYPRIPENNTTPMIGKNNRAKKVKT